MNLCIEERKYIYILLYGYCVRLLRTNQNIPLKDNFDLDGIVSDKIHFIKHFAQNIKMCVRIDAYRMDFRCVFCFKCTNNIHTKKLLT